jgi:hypothetical protein
MTIKSQDSNEMFEKFQEYTKINIYYDSLSKVFL